MRLLVVEDDRAMAGMLVRALGRQGYAVDAVATGEDALWSVIESDYDAVVLDAMIPPPDGFEVCRWMRERGRWAPVLMLTRAMPYRTGSGGWTAGRTTTSSSPSRSPSCSPGCGALTRREPRERPARLTVGDLTLDPASGAVSRGGVPVALSPKERALLHELMRHPSEVLSRTYLIDHVWDFAYDGGSNMVDVYVRYLREKVDRPFGRDTIHIPYAAPATGSTPGA
jgi:two-component system OmpR family response regulator